MIELTHEEIGKCFDFSYKVTARTEKYYRVRNQYASTEKIIFDCFIGKLAEIYTYKHLDNKGYRVSYPDFDLEFKSDKDVDLVIFKDNVTTNLHIKCVRFDSPVKDSWLIQKKELLSLKDNDYFVLTKFHSPTNIEIMKIIHHKNIIWREPKLKSLKSKLACYLSDMT